MINSGIAVAGLGVMGMHHVRIFDELDSLYGVHDIDHNRINTALNIITTSVHQFEKLDDIIKSPYVTAVSIALPTPFHADVAIKCLEAGKDVLVEKPITNNLVDAQRIIDVAKANDRILAVGYIERYNPAFVEIKRLIDAGKLGEITSINIRRVGGLPRSADNIIMDLMTHDFNLLMNIFGMEPTAIYKHTSSSNNIVNSAQVLLSFGSASATCESNWISPIKVREIHITGTGGYAKADLIKQEVTQYKSFDLASTHQQIEIQSFKGEPLKLELQAFLNAVSTRDTSKIVSGEDALRTLKVTLEALK